MASHRCVTIVVYCLVVLGAANTALSSTSLSPDFYGHSCPDALEAIQRVVRAAVNRERRMGASLLRLHFHDCFVNGCDGSILLDDSEKIESEKNANPNVNSARGFEVIDEIKREVDRVCGGPLVSCADILAVAARDSVVALGGPTWKVRLGRRDSKTASRSAADEDIPAPFFNLSQLIDNFKNHGLNEKDLVVLSGGHTIGFAQCAVFRDRIHNDASEIDPNFARDLQRGCPTSGGDTNLAPLDPTAARFDQAYFSNLLHKKGLLHSDQQLFTGGSTDGYVKKYGYDSKAFYRDFANSMIKMGNIKPLTGHQGEIRGNCRRVNSYSN